MFKTNRRGYSTFLYSEPYRSLNDINNGVNELKKIKDIVSTETLIEVEVDLGW